MLYTGYYAKLSYYKQQDLIPISISGKLPDGMDMLWWKFLAPTWYIWKNWHDGIFTNEQYTDLFYSQVLSTMPQERIEQIKNTIVEMNRNHTNYILLCYETPEQFCHRHLVADWLETLFNIDVEEYC